MSLHLKLSYGNKSASFPYPKVITDCKTGSIYLIEKDDSGNYYKIKCPGNDGFWVPKAAVLKDFLIMLLTFNPTSECAYPDIKNGLVFLVGKQKDDGFIGFLVQEGSKETYIAVSEINAKKDFKIKTRDLVEIIEIALAHKIDDSIYDAAAPVAAPVARRGRPRKFAGKRKRPALLTDEEVVADSLFASAAKIYKRIKANNKELVAEVQRLNARIEVLQAENAKHN